MFVIERIRYDDARNKTFIRVLNRPNGFLFGTVVFDGKIDEEKFRRLFGEKQLEALFGQDAPRKGGVASDERTRADEYPPGVVMEDSGRAENH
jgi:hypothetical protein